MHFKYDKNARCFKHFIFLMAVICSPHLKYLHIIGRYLTHIQGFYSLLSRTRLGSQGSSPRSEIRTKFTIMGYLYPILVFWCLKTPCWAPFWALLWLQSRPCDTRLKKINLSSFEFVTVFTSGWNKRNSNLSQLI